MIQIDPSDLSVSHKQSKVRFRDGEVNDIRNEIHSMCTMYTYFEPFPVADEDIVDMMDNTIPDAVRHHMQMCESYDPYLIPTHWRISFNVVKGSHDLSIQMAGPKQFVKTNNRLLTEASVYYPDVLKWLNDTGDRKAMVGRFLDLVHAIFRVCNTPGQVKTVYPALVELLPERHQLALAKSVRATRWPSEIGTKQEIQETTKEFENMVVLLRMVADKPLPSREYNFSVQ